MELMVMRMALLAKVNAALVLSVCCHFEASTFEAKCCRTAVGQKVSQFRSENQSAGQKVLIRRLILAQSSTERLHGRR